MSSTVIGSDGMLRCRWCSAAPEFFKYHDNEWGYPIDNDIRLFEKLCLESFQSGLSWRTILAKRDNFRSAFMNFDFDEVAKFTDDDVKRLLEDKGIIRHRGKIEAVINNAKRAQELIEQEGSLAAFFWGFEPNVEELAKPQSASTSKESIALSKALKKQGWKFVGPTTVYAFMQAIGLINDHSEECVYRVKVEQARESFIRPQNPNRVAGGVSPPAPTPPGVRVRTGRFSPKEQTWTNVIKHIPGLSSTDRVLITIPVVLTTHWSSRFVSPSFSTNANSLFG